MKVTNDNIIEFNELYYQYHNYSKVARETGYSPSTVKKYIVKDYIPISNRKNIAFNAVINFDINKFNWTDWAKLCVLSDEEKSNMKFFQKEIII